MHERWITFSGQGRGRSEDSYQIENVRYSQRTFDLGGELLDLPGILDFARLSLNGTEVQVRPDGKISLPNATPEHLALFLDFMFRSHFKIRPFDGERDYAVGAEW